MDDRLLVPRPTADAVAAPPRAGAAWNYRVLRSEGWSLVAGLSGGSALDQAWAVLVERVLVEHTVPSGAAGEPCAACAERWPCSPVRQVLASPYR